MADKTRLLGNLSSNNNIFANTATNYVGIGTTNPTSKLTVSGNANITGVITAASFSGNATSATTATNLSDAANILTGTINKDRISTTNALTVLGDLYVSNNISFGGTTTQLNAQQLNIVDADIVLGIGTSFSPTDNTANHGGIAIASTEGTPLVDLNIVPQETNPSTYKKFMWFKGSTIGAGITDAWLANYAIGIGSTQVPNGVRLAAGNVKITENDLSVVRNINASGVTTTGTLNVDGGSIVSGTTSLTINSKSNNPPVTSFVLKNQDTIFLQYLYGKLEIHRDIGRLGGWGSNADNLQIYGGLSQGPGVLNGGNILLDGGNSSNGGRDGDVVIGNTRGNLRVNTNVGIGTTNPTSKLTVVGNANIVGVVTATAYYGNGSNLTGIEPQISPVMMSMIF